MPLDAPSFNETRILDLLDKLIGVNKKYIISISDSLMYYNMLKLKYELSRLACKFQIANHKC
jgi:hypothetical protein